ncbi:unnamed protein product [Brassica rapa]|uniref:Uncharacterized protein n=1 Tax=Brassica campestris TaxID=3711 RepID=A0A8D9GES3_BRACM|nr:unnamed protein product [Brassica rapa]
MNQLFHFSSFFRLFLRLLAAKKKFSRRWSASALFTSATTNSSRRDKELLEKETIPMETESTRTGTDKSASGKANDVNNAKKIKAYIYGQSLHGFFLYRLGLALNFSVLYYEIMSSP